MPKIYTPIDFPNNPELSNDTMDKMDKAIDAIDTKVQNVTSPVASYPTNEYTSGIWRIKEWSSGRVELWGSSPLRNVNITTQWSGDFYISLVSQTPRESFPFTLGNIRVFPSIRTTSNSPALLACSSNASPTQTPQYQLVRAGAYNSYPYVIDYYVEASKA